MGIDETSVAGKSLRVTRFGNGPKTIVAVHGILGSSRTWAPIAAALPDDYTLVAMDLRGHGHSRDVPGPFGLDRHTEDVLAIADRFGPDTVLTGHSMGATIAALAGAERTFGKVVLIDGGLPLPVPPDMAPDKAVDVNFGASIERLGRTFPSVGEYVDFFLSHPVFAGWRTEGSEEYARYDALETPQGVRSRVREEAVRQNGHWLVTGAAPIAAALEKVTSPLTLVRASHGRQNEPGGMLPEAAAQHWQRRLPGLRDELIEDSNHYSILFKPRPAARLAALLTG